MSEKPIRPEIAADKLAEFENSLKDMPQRQSFGPLQSFKSKLDEAEMAKIHAANKGEANA